MVMSVHIKTSIKIYNLFTKIVSSKKGETVRNSFEIELMNWKPFNSKTDLLVAVLIGFMERSWL